MTYFPMTHGANQYGTTLETCGWKPNSLAVAATQPFSVQGVNMVHPQTLEDSGYEMIFHAAADTHADAKGHATIELTPSIIIAGPYKNVANLPANGARIKL